VSLSIKYAVVRLPVLGILFAASMLAQRDLGTITGTVTDQTNAVVPNAKITITENATGLSYNVTTDASGTYVRPALKPSTYTVQVEAAGFATLVRRDVLITAGDRVGVNLTLQVGQAAQNVEVTAGAPLLQTESTSVGGSLNSRATAELPLGGQRKIAYLARLAVGVVADEVGAAGAQGGGFSAAGVPSMGNSNYLLNGVDNNQNNIDYQGQAAYVVSLPPDAVGEVRILTNGYNAEYGRGGGGVMDVTIKSGTNQFHGVAYEFFQNEDLNTSTWDANKAGSPKGSWRQNQFGATLGGPVIKNRTFFFGNYEGLRFYSFGAAVPGTFGASTLYTIPTAAMVRGDFSQLLAKPIGTDSLGNAVAGGQIYDFLSTTPNGKGGFTRMPFAGNIIPMNRMDPVAMKILSQLPLPNQNLNSAVPGSNYFAPAQAKQNNDQGHLRIDHKFTDRDSLFGSLSWSNGTLLNPPALSQANGGALAPGYSSDLLSRLAMLSYTRIWTPTILTETRVAYTRSVQNRADSDGTIDSYKVYGIPGYDPFTSQAGGGLPTFSIDNYSSLGGPTFNPSYETTNVWSFIQNVAWNRGKHAWKFGAEFRPISLPTFQPNVSHGGMAFTKNFTNNPDPAFSGKTGDGIASFLLGYPSSFRISSTYPSYQKHDTTAFYVQDDWKVTPKLTLNIGLRYELFSPFYDDTTAQGNMVPANNPSGWEFQIGAGKNQNYPLTAGEQAFLAGAGVPVTRGKVSKYMVPWDKFDFGPRVGIAYQIQDKMVIRAAYGIFYDGEQNRGGFTPLDENPPFNEDINYTGSTFTLNPYVTRLSNGFPSDIFNQAIPSSRSLHGVAPDLLNPRVDKWNVALQRELPWTSSIEVSYLGNHMSHLFVVWDPNMPPNSPNVLVSSASFNSLRPNPALGGMPNYLSSFGYGNYDALGVSFQKRYTKGLQMTSAYTWGHSLAAAPTGPWGLGNVTSPDARNMGAIYSSSPWDIRHNWVTSGIYELPFGKGKIIGSNWNTLLQDTLGNWQINGILTLHTGHYFALTTSQGVGYLGYNKGANVIYASEVPGKDSNAAPAGGRTPNQWFDTSNIAAPIPYVQGNLGNSTNTYPGVVNIDLSVFKDIPMTERFKLTIRAEVFNLTNTPQFASIGSTQGVGNFGQLLTTVPASNRRSQLGLRISF
jgi:Carboxypeptidase regulatory-like domain/TonB dependent receptor